MGVITYVDDSATIGGTEYSLPADSTTLTAQTDDVEVQAFIDFSAMLAGDQYQIKVYETVNAGGQKVVFDSTITGVQSALVLTPALKLGTGWNITVKKLAGTDRSIAWSIRRDTADVNVATITAGAIDAATFAASAITSTVLATGAITSAKFAAGAIDAAAIAADAIGSSELAASAVTEIAAGVVDGGGGNSFSPTAW